MDGVEKGTSGARTRDHRVEGDGRTTWVNDGRGCCIGRHTDQAWEVMPSFQAAAETIRGEPLLDMGLAPDRGGWEAFRDSMLHHNGIDVGATAPTAGASED